MLHMCKWASLGEDGQTLTVLIQLLSGVANEPWLYLQVIPLSSTTGICSCHEFLNCFIAQGCQV